jgi:putative component of membrane protein insertase Oxa1/YidC/SpoIIIJ protein YidD
MKKPILLAITAYQRYISPYKGFHCAFHAHTGRDTCSGYGYRVFSRYGTLRGWRLLRRRFTACSAAATLLQQRTAANPPRLTARQAGFLDCGGCDAPGCDLPGLDSMPCDDIVNIADCCSRKPKSIRDWDCVDWLTAIAILGIIIVALFLLWRTTLAH